MDLTFTVVHIFVLKNRYYNSIIPTLHLSKKSCGRKQQNNCCLYRILKAVQISLHVDTVSNIQDF